MTFKKLFKEWRIWFLLISIFCATLAIGFKIDTSGVLIKSVDVEGPAAQAGIHVVAGKSTERIIGINSQEIKDIEDYYTQTQQLEKNSTVRITTTKQTYVLQVPETELGLEVGNVPKNNIKKGLELQGGTRVLLAPEEEITLQELEDTIDVLEKRLNVYGLSDVQIRRASDLEGSDYIRVEIAGATKEEVRQLLAQQGKFEAKIGNTTVFRGGQEDITFVCRNDGTCSRIVNCFDDYQGQASCQFEFEISLSSRAAQLHAVTTKNLAVNTTASGNKILEESIDFYVDGVQVDSLNIGADLKGQPATQILISGPGVGATQQEAIDAAIQQRTNLQTILLTGSLKTPLEIVKLDYISPTLGKEFLDNALLVGFLAWLAVGAVIFIRYRNPIITTGMMTTVAAEIYLILGFAALFRYNLDIAAIAGIIASVGTGVDDQIVITDEINDPTTEGNWKQRIKSALFVIFAAYASTVAVMLPLFKAGAGLLTGFALVTIAGVTIGVLITRQAYAAAMRVLLKE